MEMKAGQISIGRLIRNDGGLPIEIRVTDTENGLLHIQVNMTLEDFAKALTGQGHIDCEYILRGTHLYGTTREVKREEVILPSFNATKDEVRTAVAEHEVDGWIGQDGDAKNAHHKTPTKNGYYVQYTRFLRDGVPVEQD